MSKKETKAFFRALGTCKDGMAWAGQIADLKTVWDTCQRSDWMLWALDRIGFNDDRKLRLYACACIRKTPLADGRMVWDLLTDKRSRNAIEVAERYANGQATQEELASARDAARSAAWDASLDVARAARASARAAALDSALDSAWDAARGSAWDSARAIRAAVWDAAWDAAWDFALDTSSTALDTQARLLREWISWDEVDAAIKAYRERSKE